MNFRIIVFAAALATGSFSGTVLAAEEEHLPHNHIALLIGQAEEESPDGHHVSGRMFGVDYIRKFHEHWAWGVGFERESFVESNEQERHGVLAVGASYFVNERWRVFAGPGIEFRDPGEPDKAMFRIGTGYEFELSEHFKLAPEAQVDFIAGGTRVYVFALALGYGF